MKTPKSIQTTLLVLTLATAAQADVLGTARGMWFESAGTQDARQVLFGHVEDALGAKRVAMLATLVPNKDALQTAGIESGRMVGELKEADAGLLSAGAQSIFRVAAKMNKPVSLIGKWKRRPDGIGQFHCLVYVGTGPNNVLGLMHGTFGLGEAEGGDGGIDSAQKRAQQARKAATQNRTKQRLQAVRWRLSRAAETYSAANPFNVQIIDDDYVTVIDLVDPYSSANPFSVPKRSIRSGEFVAQWLSR